eukprot:CAMPEP_0204212370 /NCGR_PEP_ID=MMETSP0361-20130328/75195_1 /ASSEMBLY_ACC=CAM_ASM_000343 /TAXON_ID=268821 /ORGANISM="Scrippsiella Hangoei, Strain SHTV-5" /LENGTH=53 /DNA_ID=CAMNT_0051176691 /DNA_START=204 /DNA_END=361 /DNA_ORIENTATION=-
METQTAWTVRAGLQWSYNTDRQMCPLEQMWGCSDGSPTNTTSGFSNGYLGGKL